MLGLPKAAAIYRVANILAAAIGLAYLLSIWNLTLPTGDALPAALLNIAGFIAALTYAGLHPVALVPNRKSSIGAALMFAAAVTVDPPVAAMLSMAGAGLYNALLKRSWHNTLYNMAHHGLSVGIGSATFHLLNASPAITLLELGALGAAVIAGTVYFFAATTGVNIMVALTQKRPVAKEVVGGWKDTWLQYLSMLATGYMGAVLYGFQPVALVLLLPSVLLGQRGNRQFEAIRTANEALKHTLQRQRQFVSNVSHELRTPLTSIQGNLEYIQDEARMTLPKSLQTPIEDAARQVDRLSRVVGHLLAAAQLEEGQPLQTSPADIEAISYEVYLQMRPNSNGVRMDFSMDESAHDGVMAMLDTDKYRLLLRNLLDNALKYTGHGEIHVRVRPAGSQVEVEVSDTGIGIPLTEQQHIFERFYRVDGPQAKNVPGTGLGLAIARQIAEAHGGTLNVTSEPGKGSTFTLYLPAVHQTQSTSLM